MRNCREIPHTYYCGEGISFSMTQFIWQRFLGQKNAHSGQGTSNQAPASNKRANEPRRWSSTNWPVAADTGEAVKGTLPVPSAPLAGRLLADQAAMVGNIEVVPVITAVGATPITTAETDATTKGRRDRGEAAYPVDSSHGRPARRRSGCCGGE